MKKTLTLAAALTITGLALTSCGLAGGGDDADLSHVDENKTIRIIVTESAPFQEPTEIVKEKLAEDGWTLETTYVTDIIQPNNAVQNGEYDANFFQHQAYLDQFNTDNDTSVVPQFSVYYGTSGFFSTRHDSLDDLPDGAQISIPVDTSNNGRALALLAEEGVIEIDDSIPVTKLSQNEITSNPKNLQFVEVDQQSLGQTLPDVDAGFSFVRLIAEAGYELEDTVLAYETDPDVTSLFTVVVAAKPEFRDTEAARVLEEAYQSEEVEEWFDQYQGGGVVDYVDDITLDNAEEQWAQFAN